MTLTLDDNVPMNLWGKDHWSTLAYIETVMVDHGGFQIGLDPHMRSNRRNFRVMSQECPNPKRTKRGMANLAMVMDIEKHSSRLSDGSTISGHDDWCCVQDMAELGLFTCGQDDVEPGVTLHFSPFGRDIANKLREHKASGGNFANFVFSAESAPTP